MTATIPHGHTGIVGEVADLLADREAGHHAEGWDNSPPALYAVVRDEAGVLDAFPFPLGLVRHPRVELEMIATAMSEPFARDLYQRCTPGAAIAWLLVMEMWRQQGRPGETSQDADRRLRGHAFADLPGSVEVRLGVGVVGRHRFILQRERGHPPEWIDVDADDPFGGDMFTSLTKIASASRDMVI